jgi:hypothetical protein
VRLSQTAAKFWIAFLSIPRILDRQTLPARWPDKRNDGPKGQQSGPSASNSVCKAHRSESSRLVPSGIRTRPSTGKTPRPAALTRESFEPTRINPFVRKRRIYLSVCRCDDYGVELFRFVRMEIPSEDLYEVYKPSSSAAEFEVGSGGDDADIRPHDCLKGVLRAAQRPSRREFRMFAHFFGVKGTGEAQIPPLSADLGAILSIENGAGAPSHFPGPPARSAVPSVFALKTLVRHGGQHWACDQARMPVRVKSESTRWYFFLHSA